MLLAVTLVYLLFLLGYGLYSTYVIHHLNEYGYSGDASQQVLRLYVGCAGTVLFLTAVLILYAIIG
jgi:hypothetical protein